MSIVLPHRIRLVDVFKTLFRSSLDGRIGPELKCHSGNTIRNTSIARHVRRCCLCGRLRLSNGSRMPSQACGKMQPSIGYAITPLICAICFTRLWAPSLPATWPLNRPPPIHRLSRSKPVQAIALASPASKMANRSAVHPSYVGDIKEYPHTPWRNHTQRLLFQNRIVLRMAPCAVLEIPCFSRNFTRFVIRFCD